MNPIERVLRMKSESDESEEKMWRDETWIEMDEQAEGLINEIGKAKQDKKMIMMAQDDNLSIQLEGGHKRSDVGHHQEPFTMREEFGRERDIYHEKQRACYNHQTQEGSDHSTGNSGCYHDLCHLHQKTRQPMSLLSFWSFKYTLLFRQTRRYLVGCLILVGLCFLSWRRMMMIEQAGLKTDTPTKPEFGLRPTRKILEIQQKATVGKIEDSSSDTNNVDILLEPLKEVVIVYRTPEERAYKDIGATDYLRYRKQMDHFSQEILGSEPISWEVIQQIIQGSRLSVELWGSIPKVIHQTGPKALSEVEESYVNSWKLRNPNHQYTISDDDQIQQWFKTHFKHQKELKELWKELEGVMRYDLWRYLKLYKIGGVYSDLDTVCLKSIEEWQLWKSQAAGFNDRKFWLSDPNLDDMNTLSPRVIVGIEADVGDRSDWAEWWPRPIQIVQWTISSIPNHPILIDTIRRIYQDTKIEKLILKSIKNQKTINVENNREEEIMRIVKKTGPGIFTDSVIRYIKMISKDRFDWKNLKNCSDDGIRIGDLLILPISAFSPGIKNMGAQEIDYEGAYVHHQFAGSWKPPIPQE